MTRTANEPLRMAVQRLRRSVIREGKPFPLGATWDGVGVNFALFSAHATRVELCLFDEKGDRELERVDLPEYTDEVWHGYLPNARPGTVYGYRVHGPFEPDVGHRFNPNKLLLDPYAKQLVGQITWGPQLFAYRFDHPDKDKSFDDSDSAALMQKCRVIDPAFTWGSLRKPDTPWEQTIFYETHVKGFTKLHPLVPAAERGTYLGLSNAHVRDYVKSLGVTAVELLPIHSFVDDSYLVEKGLRNYWGYNSLAFFAPEPRYMRTREVSEFKTMVNQYHASGLEIILDVVYNHTAEGNELGPTLSFKGIDNVSYYRLAPDKRYYINDTGTGNTVNLSHQRVIQMVTDSLRYWANEMRVDGFRFDLATILAREPHGFDEGGGFLDACRADPTLNGVKLIAEPWDIGPGGYQVGQFPPGWAEWNDKFRDAVRSFWKGDARILPEFAKRISGSGDLFDKRGRKTWSTVNFITAHDGFNLNDLVAYNDKHNEANGEGNRDGHSNNHSWNHGAEGETSDIEITNLRERQKRNMLATVLLSRGTPMILAGDEIGHSQKGNNNAYAQDNEVTWLDWLDIGAQGQLLRDFAKKLISIRKAYPVLSRGRFVVGTYNDTLGVKDVTWLCPTGGEMLQTQWDDANAKCFGMLLDGRAQETGIRKRGEDSTVLLVYNAHYDVVNFTLPEVTDGRCWSLLADTNAPLLRATEHTFGEAYSVTGRSMVVFSLLTIGGVDLA
jgi:isoamylase